MIPKSLFFWYNQNKYKMQCMPNKEFVQKLGFLPKNNASGVFYKKFSAFEYVIEVDFGVKKFNFGTKIKSESGTTLNFSQEENWVVLECVNRLLEKGYKPEDIILEKVYPTGHGTSGRLDILVKKDRKAYLMIECKTWGSEYEKALKKMQKDGGQLFTYFQQDRNAEYLILYTSNIDEKGIDCKNEIIKIEEHYREAGNVKDFYDRWNKLAKQNGIFDDWVNAYEFQSRALKLEDLKEIKEDDAQNLFNNFAGILRKHVVSDKSNAFNKIFNLFLCKIRDEYDDHNKKREANFQWKDNDSQEKFQSRLNRLYKDGMKIFLNKDIVDFDEEDLNKKFPEISHSPKLRDELLHIINEIRFKKSNEFAIKEVHDQKSFEENGIVLKELVELIQKYQIRYDKRHPYLSNFFELLLTTGLKQESGQFFTPVPVARFIIKSFPLKERIADKFKKEDFNDLLPTIIDYAAGSGHFLHESMHELQTIIDEMDVTKFSSDVSNEVSSWKIGKFKWAKNYIYGIEKDYRLAKVAKVGCYLHGDGLAQVIHGDGLDDFYESNDYDGLLRKKNSLEKEKNNQVFDFVISNPPYSVTSFKANLKNIFNAFGENRHSFDLYENLTDQSSEIECLFIERTKQLLKEGGLAGVILPSSILSNTGIYTKTRELILKYFEIVAITELGSGTFMATGTSTVVLFLRRKNNYEWENIQSSVEKFFQNHKDVTVNGIENIFSKYVKYVWDVKFEEYISLCKNATNENIENHEIYKEYKKKLKVKDSDGLHKKIIKKEQEKLLYFILAYKQKVVLIKSGKKKEEKRFLGYEFSNRRGYEGIHSIQRGKSIDECTEMFDPENQENQGKANFYVYKAFLGEIDLKISESMRKHVFRTNLVDMMTFDRIDFEKKININAESKVKFISNFRVISLDDLVTFQSGLWKGERKPLQKTKVLRNTNFKLNNGRLDYSDVEEIEVEVGQFENRKLRYGDIILEKSGGSDTQAIGRVVLFDKKTDADKYSYSNFCTRIRVIDDKTLDPVYLWLILNDFYNKGGTIPLQNGIRLLNIDMGGYKKIKIPLPPKNIQEKIVDEIKKIEQKEEKAKEEFDKLKKSISQLLPQNNNLIKIENIATLLKRGKSPQYGNSKVQIIKSGQARGYKDFDFSDKHFASENFVLDERKLEKGDILINSTGVGTAGRVTMFDLDGDYVVDSHITILRLDRTKALPDYVLQYFCDLGFKTIEAMALGQSGQIELALETIKNIKIPLPSLNDQKKIVAQIMKIEDQIFKYSQEIEKIKKQKVEILKKYL